MTNDKATRRYFTALVPAAALYLAASLAFRLADNADLLAGPLLYGAALLPVAAMLGMFWAQWRYVREIDEFLRSIQIRAAFIGLATIMALATAWGFLELATALPALQIYWLNPLYWVTYSLAAVVLNLREGGLA